MSWRKISKTLISDINSNKYVLTGNQKRSSSYVYLVFWKKLKKLYFKVFKYLKISLDVDNLVFYQPANFNSKYLIGS
jgi:hypothetical protein